LGAPASIKRRSAARLPDAVGKSASGHRSRRRAYRPHQGPVYRLRPQCSRSNSIATFASRPAHSAPTLTPLQSLLTADACNGGHTAAQCRCQPLLVWHRGLPSNLVKISGYTNRASRRLAWGDPTDGVGQTGNRGGRSFTQSAFILHGMAMLKLLERVGRRLTSHGLRSSFPELGAEITHNPTDCRNGPRPRRQRQGATGAATFS